MSWKDEYIKTCWQLWDNGSKTAEEMFNGIGVYIEALIKETEQRVANDCIETLNGCMYQDYEDMCNVLKKTYKIGEQIKMSRHTPLTIEIDENNVNYDEWKEVIDKTTQNICDIVMPVVKNGLKIMNSSWKDRLKVNYTYNTIGSGKDLISFIESLLEKERKETEQRIENEFEIIHKAGWFVEDTDFEDDIIPLIKGVE